MRPLHAALVSVVSVLLAQCATLPILSSHDRIEGPFKGAYRAEDLKIFKDGKVIYVEEATATFGSGKAERSSFLARINSDDLRRLLALLDSQGIRSLPKRVPPMAPPIDFFWVKVLDINRKATKQRVEIENFYPFANRYGPVYPSALIELECTLQDIKSAVAKRQRPDDDVGWCKAVLTQGRTSTQPDCHEEDAQPKIVAGEGWGPVRMGATSKTFVALLGKGQNESKSALVRFKDYPPKGIQVSFDARTDTVSAIFFYNGQLGDEEIGRFCGQTDRGIDWRASTEDVKRTYGQPTAEFSGTDWGGTWQRLVFTGIDFRFENGKMVRIGIPGK